MLEQDETVTSHLSPAELDECFELAYHYKHVDEVFKRLGLEKITEYSRNINRTTQETTLFLGDSSVF